MKLLGVDPGVHGGLAVVNIIDGVAPELVGAIDIPTVGLKAKERVDVHALRTWVEAQRPDHAAIERAQAMPKQGASSGFKYGRAVGAIEAVIMCCAVPLTIIEPTAWKKNFMGFTAVRRSQADSVRCSSSLPRTRCLLAKWTMAAQKRR